MNNFEKNNFLKSNPQFVIYYFSKCEFVASAECDSEKEALQDLISQKIDLKEIDFKLICDKKNDSYYGDYFNYKKARNRVRHRVFSHQLRTKHNRPKIRGCKNG